MKITLFQQAITVLIATLLVKHGVSQSYHDGLKLSISHSTNWTTVVQAPAPILPYTITGDLFQINYCSSFQDYPDSDKTWGKFVGNCMNLDIITTAYESLTPLEFLWEGQWNYHSSEMSWPEVIASSPDIQTYLTINGISNEAEFASVSDGWIDFSLRVVWTPTADIYDYPVIIVKNSNELTWNSYDQFRHEPSDEIKEVIFSNAAAEYMRHYYEICSAPDVVSNINFTHCFWPGISCEISEQGVRISGLTISCSNLDIGNDFVEAWMDINITHISLLNMKSVSLDLFPENWKVSLSRMSMEMTENVLWNSLNEFTNLVILNLGSSSTNSTELDSFIYGLPSLRFLRISLSGQVSLDGCAQWPSTNTLEILDLDFGDRGISGFGELYDCDMSAFVSLTKLSISEMFFDVHWHGQGLPTSLEQFILEDGAMNGLNMGNMSYLTSLTFLVLNQVKFTYGISENPFPNSLKNLSLKVSNNMATLPNLSGMEQLEEVELSNVKIEDSSNLPQSAQLTLIVMNDIYVNTSLVFPELISLQTLELSITDQSDFPDFSRLSQLTYLNLRGKFVNSEMSTSLVFPELISLQTLELSITDQSDFPDFSRLSQLTSLTLTGNFYNSTVKLDDDVFPSSLQYFSCQYCSFYEPLPETFPLRLQNLTHLDLSHGFLYSPYLKLRDGDSIDNISEIANVSMIPKSWEEWIETKTTLTINLYENSLQGFFFPSQEIQINENPTWSCSRGISGFDDAANDLNCDYSNNTPLKLLYMSQDIMSFFSGELSIDMSIYVPACANSEIKFRTQFSTSTTSVIGSERPAILNVTWILSANLQLALSDASEKPQYFSIMYCNRKLHNLAFIFDFSCAPGQYANLPENGDISGKKCIECLIGSFSNIRDAASCEKCPKNTYGNTDGLSACLDCPFGTTLNTGTVSIDGCVCSEGEFGDYRGCFVCMDIEGVTCNPGTKIPQVDPGLWLDPADYSIAFTCIPREACNFTENGETSCSTGYEGYRCGECSPNYFKSGFTCLPCPESTFYVEFMFFVVFLLGCLGAIRSSVPRSSKLHSIGVALSWIQILALYSGLPVQWPRSVSKLFTITSFFNFNIELFSPECSVEMDYWIKWHLKLAAPLVIFSGFLVIYIIQNILDYFRPNKPKIFVMSLSHFFMEINRSIYCIKRLRNRSLPQLDPQEYAQKDIYRNARYVYACMLTLTVLYTFLCSTVVEPLNCSEQGNGIYVMNYMPTSVCFDENWRSEVLPSMIGFGILYIVGIPVFLFSILIYYRYQLSSKHFLNKFGFLVLPYRLQNSFFEIFNLVRKAAVVIMLDLFALTNMNHIEILGCLVLMMFFAGIYLHIAPYRSPHNNMNSLLWILISIYCLFAAIIFSSTSLGDFEKEFYGTSICIAFGFACMYSLYATFQEAKGGVYGLYTERKLNSHMLELTANYERELQEYFPKTADLMADYLSKQGYGRRAQFFTDLRMWQTGTDIQRNRVETVHHDFRTAEDTLSPHIW